VDRAPKRALLLFLDGVGVGEEDPLRNPVAAARMPVLDGLLGGRAALIGAAAHASGPASFRAVDARLGVEGLPQSGTGQTSLLAGVNAAEILGRHFGPWVHTRLRDLLASDNLLSRTLRAGRVPAFANAYPHAYLTDRSGRVDRRPAAPPFAARAAGALTRDERDLHAGTAVASEIEHTAWIARVDPTLHPVTAAAAGATLAGIAATADVTLFAHYATDTVGHTRDHVAAVEALERVDRFIGGLLAAADPDLLVVITSDHGNIEDVAAAHTLNPVPLIAVGPGAETVAAGATSIADVAPAMLRLLGIP
jgi:2,3-bisphosphoglycerate-independent phosphoglycerate mutase